jgi:hypothetical protein
VGEALGVLKSHHFQTGDLFHISKHRALLLAYELGGALKHFDPLALGAEERIAIPVHNLVVGGQLKLPISPPTLSARSLDGEIAIALNGEV